MKNAACLSVGLVCLLFLPVLVASDDHKAGERLVLKIEGVEYAFRWCPVGTFTMGSPSDELGRFERETQHRVTLSRGFWMLETEVAQEMWESVMGNNPSNFKGAKLPVEYVSWDDCQKFIEQLNSHLAGTPGAPAGYKFSLPTEAQWEYACRAGTTTALNSGKDLTDEGFACANLDELGWYGWFDRRDEKEMTTHAVGQKKPNAWGLYDMHGNVWEWCSDWYGDYPSGVVTDPTGTNKASIRVLRGGCWCDHAGFCRSAIRNGHAPSARYFFYGVRLSLVRVK